MSEDIETILNKISGESNAAVKGSEKILKHIKDLKKSLMKKYLELEDVPDIYKAYGEGFTTFSGETVKLHELAAADGIVCGMNFQKGVNEQNSNRVPVLTPGNIKSLKFDPAVKLFAATDRAGCGSDCLTQSWDIIISVDEKDIGASAIVPMTDTKYMPGENIIRLRLDHSLCEVFYVLNILHFYYNTGLMSKIISDADTDSISGIKIPLPAIEKQKQIADTMLQLSAAMSVHENYCRDVTKFMETVNTL